MAAQTLMDGLSADGAHDDGDDTFKPSVVLRLTRRATRNSLRSQTVNPRGITPSSTSPPEQMLRFDSITPAPSGRQKVVPDQDNDLLEEFSPAHHNSAESAQDGIVHKEKETSPSSLDVVVVVTRPIRPAVTSEDMITSSANDKNIDDTISRMQQYLNDKNLLVDLNAGARRRMVKGLKASFSNRYKGRCTALERRDYIARWVELAAIHNELLVSATEQRALGIEIDLKWLEEEGHLRAK